MDKTPSTSSPITDAELTTDELHFVYMAGYQLKARAPEMDRLFDVDWDAAVLECEKAGIADVATIIRRTLTEAY